MSNLPNDITPFQGYGIFAAIHPQGGALGYHIPPFQGMKAQRSNPHNKQPAGAVATTIVPILSNL
jgi:hypothetical protein